MIIESIGCKLHVHDNLLGIFADVPSFVWDRSNSQRNCLSSRGWLMVG
jgi:penicillin V acylase-like amidase (Ntn superfamily)